MAASKIGAVALDLEDGGKTRQHPAGVAGADHALSPWKGARSRADEKFKAARLSPKPERRSIFINGSGTGCQRPVTPEAVCARTDKQLQGKIKAFQDKREEERRRMFRAVVRVGLYLLAAGSTLIALGHGLQFAIPRSRSPNSYLGYAATSLVILGFAICMLGMVVGSCCPYDLLDLDIVATKNPKSIAAFAFLISMVSLLQTRYFPHLDAVKVFVGLTMALTALAGACGARPPPWWPAITAGTVLYLSFDGFSWGAIFLCYEQNNWLAIPETPSRILGGINFFYGIAAFAGLFWHRWHYADHEYGNSIRFYKVAYCWCLVGGFRWTFYGLTWMLHPKEGSEDIVAGALEVARGLCTMLPTLAVLFVGRNHFFEILGLSFDQDGTRLRRDGAFVAELLETVPVEPGMTWWIHREVPDENYPALDTRRCWQRGVVTEVMEEGEFAVRIREPTAWGGRAPRTPGGRGAAGEAAAAAAAEAATQRVRLPTAGKGESKEELLLRAQRDLRCVEFKDLSPELMCRVDSRNDPELQAAWHALSRPVLPGERIDYFMSNSWYDNPETKWEKLVEVAKKFHQVHARDPTFWLDKLCIDQQQITDGLKVLPVNVMACNKLLALCGDTYLSRLWCIWELFTLFAFVDEQAALDRIKFVFLGSYEEGMRMLDGMAKFHVNRAHCYDPNEEARLLKVIKAVGMARFDARIATMARMTKARMEEIHRKEGNSAKRLLSLSRRLWRSLLRKSYLALAPMLPSGAGAGLGRQQAAAGPAKQLRQHGRT